MKKILVSAISIVNPIKKGSEIYTIFAKRLINDVISKTPYDVLISTNRIDLFEDIIQENNNRVTIRQVDLQNHKTHVGVFNQLLKFYAIKDIDKKYDWVLYLDCDAGFTESVNPELIDEFLTKHENNHIDFLGTRVNATYANAEKEFLDSQKNNTKHLFDQKFLFYGINPDWRPATLPSEHILILKNSSKINVMCKEFEKFCTLFETQDSKHPITWDMEAFEIGVSAFIAGYNVEELGWGNHCELLKVGFNFNNWEKIKR